MVVATVSVARPFDWRRTIAYIEQNGADVERARLRGILGRSRPDAKVIRAIEARQNDDGGFPYGRVPGRFSAIATTAEALDWMQDLGLLRSPQAERALTYLQSMQRPDGSWDEPPSLIKYAPLPRFLPGDPRVRMVSTARVAYWLARVGPRDDHAIARALGYLRERQAADGRFTGFLQTTWLATALFRLVEGEGGEAASRGLGALDAVEAARWHTGSLSEMLNVLGEAGVRESHPVVRKNLARLVIRSRPDGSWLSEDGDLYHVEVSLRGLRALLLFGTVSPRVDEHVPAPPEAAS